MSDIRKAFAAIASKAPRKFEIDADGEKLTVYMRNMKLPDYVSVSTLSELPIAERMVAIPGVLARFICDEKGVLIYDADKAEDVAELAALDLATLGALTNAMNNVKPDEKDKGEATASPN